MREKLLLDGVPFVRMNADADRLVCAKAQAGMYRTVFAKLTEAEQAVLKRGRNLHGSKKTKIGAKTGCVSEYRHATGLEVLFGYLYANGETDRLREVFALCVAPL